MKSLNKQLLIALVVVMLCAVLGGAHDYIPGALPDHPILLKNGTIHTVANGTIENADLLFNNGLIEQIGPNLTPPESTEIIELNGAHLYPGLIAANSSLGLVEIGSVRATRDNSEIGRINPNVQARVAYNPDSEIIPTVRSNGVTTALIVPGGSLLTGQSTLMNLDGWSYETSTLKHPVAMHLNWPRSSISTGWWETRSVEEQKEDMARNRRTMFKLFDDARAYYTAKKTDREPKPDSRWESMIPLFDGQLPLFVHANDYRQIVQAVAFASDLGVRMVLVGGADSWMLTDLLKENDIPVIVDRTQKLPPREDDSHDLAYQLPALLEKAGVRFCISTSGASGTRNLMLQPAQSIPYGLSYESALRSITLSPAEILGVDKTEGSLEVGKHATLVISTGDILDLLSHEVTMMFVNGCPVDLSDKHKELRDKYTARPK